MVDVLFSKVAFESTAHIDREINEFPQSVLKKKEKDRIKNSFPMKQTYTRASSDTGVYSRLVCHTCIRWNEFECYGSAASNVSLLLNQSWLISPTLLKTSDSVQTSFLMKKLSAFCQL